MMLQCHLCDKPFTNTSSHTRHLRYCLKTRNRPRVRQKSCQACSASKVKCTFHRPSCARCHKKGTDCVYDDEARPTPDQTPTPSMTNVEPAHAEFQVWDCEFPETTQLIDWSAIDHFLSDTFSTPPTVDIDFSVQPELATFLTDFSPANTSVPSVFLGTVPAETSQPQQQTTTLTTASSSPPQTITVTQTSTPLTISPSTPVIHPTILTLHQNSHITTRTDPAAKYSLISIIRGLRSYPLMMTEKETFPPLIHPHLLDMSSPNSSSTVCPTPREIISKCMSLSHLYTLRTPETSPYLWDAILEQSNHFMTHLASSSGSALAGLSSASLIAAIQAQLIYVLMRIVDCSAAVSNSTTSSDPGSRNRELNLNYSIMYVFKKLCETFVDRFGSEEMYFESYKNNNHHHNLPLSNTDPSHFTFELEAAHWTHKTPAEEANSSPLDTASLRGSERRLNWENWIVSESWRRMKVIFFLMEKIVDVNMGASVKCTSRYADVDWIMLPCSKSLWEARSENEWEARLDTYNTTRPRLGERLDTIGGLLRAHKGAMDGGLGTGMQGCAEFLDRWHVEADGLGALLNASLGMV